MLTGVTFYSSWIFLFSNTKASDANIGIIANFGSFEKPLLLLFRSHKISLNFLLLELNDACALVTFPFHLTKSCAETKRSQGVFHRHNHLIHLIETIPIDVIHESTPQRFFSKEIQFVSLDALV